MVLLDEIERCLLPYDDSDDSFKLSAATEPIPIPRVLLRTI